MTTVRFDEAIPTAIHILQERFGETLPETTFVRDALGTLTVVLPDDTLAMEEEWDHLADRLSDVLGAYSPGPGQVLLRVRDLIDPSDVIESSDRIRLPDVPNVWLVDRLLTNQDWLRKSLLPTPPIPTAVVYSIKGGVGRTTACALWAWHLARQGKNVLLVDLDLEAPGLGSLVLDALPDYGLLDWLVEGLLGQTDESFLRECLIDSPLGRDAPGIIRVLPGFGTKTKDYVGKLGRVYMPSPKVAGMGLSGLADKLCALLQMVSGLSDAPDAILLDSRAGLHDIGAAAVTRLGAEIFLFARNEAQSWRAYTHLFEHLRRAHDVVLGMPDDDLRWRLKMVAAQLDPSEHARAAFTDASYASWTELYDDDVPPESTESGCRPQIFSREDRHAPHYPIVVAFDPRVKDFNLISPANRPDWRLIETAFGDFFEQATARLLGYASER